jgi:hypothetical protein
MRVTLDLPAMTLPLHLVSNLFIPSAITTPGEKPNSQIPRKQILRNMFHKDQEAL